MEALPATKALSALAKRQREGERSTSRTVRGCGSISGLGFRGVKIHDMFMIKHPPSSLWA